MASAIRRALIVAVLMILLWPVAAVLILRVADPPTSALMVIRRLNGYSLDHRPVPLTEVAPALRFAVIAAEDNRFCSHFGIEWQALLSEFDRWWSGAQARGASTITMQIARNLFLWPGRQPVRKLLELPLALLIESFWSKRRILEVYLQIVELGPGIFGAEAAAQHWFGKPARALSRREAAQLAAMLPAPLWRRPGQPAVMRLAATIERRMAQLGPLLDCVR